MREEKEWINREIEKKFFIQKKDEKIVMQMNKGGKWKKNKENV